MQCFELLGKREIDMLASVLSKNNSLYLVKWAYYESYIVPQYMTRMPGTLLSKTVSLLTNFIMFMSFGLRFLDERQWGCPYCPQVGYMHLYQCTKVHAPILMQWVRAVCSTFTLLISMMADFFGPMEFKIQMCLLWVLKSWFPIISSRLLVHKLFSRDFDSWVLQKISSYPWISHV